jgi:hypothetical protein
VLDVPAHGPGQHLRLHVLTGGDQRVRPGRVVDPVHVLLDDRPLVQLGRHVVRGRPDQLHPALVRLVIGPGAGEGRQERVVDVDGPPGQLRAQAVGEHLHVAGQHDQVDPLGRHQVEQRLLGDRLLPRRHRDVVERHPVPRGQRREVAVVGDHADHVGPQCPALPPEQQVVEAVPGLADQDQHPGPVGDVVQRPVHPEVAPDRGERAPQRGQVQPARRVGLRPQEEPPGQRVGELLAVDHVAAGVGQVPGHGPDDPGLVRTGQRQDEPRH